MGNRLKMIFNSGKNPKWKYYAAAILRNRIPDCIYRRQLSPVLDNIADCPDLDRILARVDYYCRDFNDITACVSPEEVAKHPELSEMQEVTTDTLQPTDQMVYYYDTVEFTRMFPDFLRMNLLPGDIAFTSPIPALVKSRPIEGDNRNSALFKLDKVRHFIFAKDRIPFRQKRQEVLFRGKVNGKQNRIEFMQKLFKHDGFDLGAVDSHPVNAEWLMPKLTIGEQLEYGIIMSLEGNDVASNLKWLMSSNSLVFTPKLRCESWFMEGTLIPGVHFVEIADDFSDIKEKAYYYFSHPDEAEKIIHNANAYASEFRDKRREYVTEVLTLGKYLALMNPGKEIHPGLRKLLNL